MTTCRPYHHHQQQQQVCNHDNDDIIISGFSRSQDNNHVACYEKTQHLEQDTLQTNKQVPNKMKTNLCSASSTQL